ARLDGQPETIWRANYLFKAVEIPSGEHRLSIAYRPTWFYMGFAISCLAWAGFGGMIYFIRRFST
ncbi:MAG: YfhO family protein, partial [Anaerolineales bacterium]|nr:YfhO family protein [Anaerolineales bacterium]